MPYIAVNDPVGKATLARVRSWTRRAEPLEAPNLELFGPEEAGSDLLARLADEVDRRLAPWPEALTEAHHGALEVLADEIALAPGEAGAGPAGPEERTLIGEVLRGVAAFGPLTEAGREIRHLRGYLPILGALFAVPLDETTTPDFIITRVREIRRVCKLWAELTTRGEALPQIHGHFQSLADADSLVPDTHPHALLRVQNVPFHRTDRGFALQRVAGKNPVTIQRVTPAGSAIGLALDVLGTRTPFSVAALNRALQPHGAGPFATLAAAVQTGLLYACDYTFLADFEEGAWEHLGKHLAPCLGLFWSAPGGLVPVAVSRGTDAGAEVVLPGEARWPLARAWLQNGDCIHHEMWSHLGRAHGVLRAAARATREALPRDHVVRKLLAPHFDGVRLNMEVGERVLINEDGMVDQLLSPVLGRPFTNGPGSLDVAAAAIATWTVGDLDVRQDLARRGVDRADLLPYYPYRDDALAVYDALHAYVAAVLLPLGPLPGRAAWRDTLAAMPGFGPHAFASLDIDQPDAIVNLVAGLAFLSSGFHSAVNYPQWDFTMVPHAMPMGLYRDPAAAGDEVGLLPTVTQHVRQVEAAWLLSVHRFGSLLTLPPLPGHEGAGGALIQRLQAIEAYIANRNAALPHETPPYDYLLPSRVPPAANV